MAIAIDPKCISALEGRAVIHYSMRNFFGALVDISKAIVCIQLFYYLTDYYFFFTPQEINPNVPEFLVNRGVIYQALNENMFALQSYKVGFIVVWFYEVTYFLKLACYNNGPEILFGLLQCS